MKSHLALSEELDLLRLEFEPYEKEGGFLPADEISRLRRRLSLLAKLARSQETELAIQRLIEAGRVQLNTMGDCALEAAGDLILAAEGNVIRPDFGKKK
ncbi:hypothetical protein J2046_003052 [Rhizobium petrolearium]|uniref:hypothetical protein n=1 Tax=Neorhizobium petrolearium TaxID=515361 RepID=UPI001AEAC600|nr:hypothetical protein [Neorhizobium petrolearium]MBP1844785.1 hypothetical protein [Neorhizobium petrolearium]